MNSLSWGEYARLVVADNSASGGPGMGATAVKVVATATDYIRAALRIIPEHTRVSAVSDALKARMPEIPMAVNSGYDRRAQELRVDVVVRSSVLRAAYGDSFDAKYAAAVVAAMRAALRVADPTWTKIEHLCLHAPATPAEAHFMDYYQEYLRQSDPSVAVRLSCTFSPYVLGGDNA